MIMKNSSSAATLRQHIPAVHTCEIFLIYAFYCVILSILHRESPFQTDKPIINLNMKSLKALLLAVAAILTVAVPAAAQFRIGPRVGTEVNSMRLNKEVFDSENRAGFTGGVMCEFTVPIINLGFDLSVMYVHRVNGNSYIDAANQENSDLINASSFKKRDYIEIPLNLKYKIGLPVVGKIISPYIFTGPSFSILASKREITDAYRNKAFDVAWNVGAGLELFSHLQVGASYGFGMNKTVEWIGKGVQANPIEGKNNYWTITAAWLF